MSPLPTAQAHGHMRTNRRLRAESGDSQVTGSLNRFFRDRIPIASAGPVDNQSGIRSRPLSEFASKRPVCRKPALFCQSLRAFVSAAFGMPFSAPL